MAYEEVDPTCDKPAMADKSERRKCNACRLPAQVYASDTIADGWADFFCHTCAPRGWFIEPYTPN